MAFKDLLVVADRSRNCRARLDVAVQLASAFDAHLVGLYVTGPPHIPQSVLAQIPAEVLAAQAQALRDEAAKTKRSSAHGPNGRD